MTWDIATALKPSAHVDTFCRDHLPPGDSWPEMIFELPGVRYADRLNCATELLTAVKGEEEKPEVITGPGPLLIPQA